MSLPIPRVPFAGADSSGADSRVRSAVPIPRVPMPGSRGTVHRDGRVLDVTGRGANLQQARERHACGGGDLVAGHAASQRHSGRCGGGATLSSEVPSATPVVGILGGSQLARMLAEAATPLGVHVRVLAAPGDEGTRWCPTPLSATRWTPTMWLGSRLAWTC
ncbi:MAG: hypothetical protein R2789_14245 [Microthrixaceae bacterium]